VPELCLCPSAKAAAHRPAHKTSVPAASALVSLPYTGVHMECRGCGGDLPPPCSTRLKPYPDHDSSYQDSYKDYSYYPRANAYGFGHSHKKDPCRKAEAAYAWSPDCAKAIDLGSTCEGAALCSTTNAHTTALATCTAWGWVVEDGCKPLGCAGTPVSQLATFSGCKTPGVLEQECEGTCQVPSVGGPVATCTPAGWAIPGPLCGKYCLHAHQSC
jgi:hypothetical protein